MYVPNYQVAGWADSWLGRLPAEAPRPTWSRRWRYWLFARVDPEVARWRIASLSQGGWRRRMAVARGVPGLIYLVLILIVEAASWTWLLAMFVAVVVIGAPAVFGGGLRERELRRLRRTAAKHR